MKFALPVAVVLRFRSLPVRGAWIEIVSVPWIDVASIGRSP